MNKTFCDICKKEIKQGDAFYIKIAPIAVGIIGKNYPEVCKTCTKEIELTILGLHK